MINKIYRKVLGTDDRPFNPDKDYYTVLLNFAGDAKYYNAFKSDRERYVVNNAFTELSFDLSQLGDEVLGEALRNNKYAGKVETLYALLFDYETADISRSVFSAIDTVIGSHAMKSGDKLALIITVPDDGRDNEQSKSFVKALDGYAYPDNMSLYLFPKRIHEGNAIVDSICGALLLCSDKANAKSVDINRGTAGQFVDASVDSFSAKEQIVKNKPTYWTTLIAEYNDDKMDFLRSHVYNLYKKAEDISSLNFAQIFNEYIETHGGVTANESAWQLRLERAVKCIPAVSGAKHNEQMSLRNHFAFLYGTQGEETVELTLRVNLAQRPPFTNHMVNEAAETVFERVKEYHSRDLMGDVLRFLDNYIAETDKIAADQKAAIKSFVNKADTDVNDDTHEYISKYIRYNNVLKMQEFWQTVKEYIVNNTDKFATYCKNAARMAEELDEIVKDLSFVGGISVDDRCPSYTALRLLAADTDEEICNTVREEYNRSTANVGDVPADKWNRTDDDFAPLFRVIPGLCKDFDYEFAVKGTYTAKLRQRIGKYLAGIYGL